MSDPHAARGGILPLPKRQYTEMVLPIMRQYAENYNRICGRIQKVTTTHTAVCGKLHPHMRQNTDGQSHAEMCLHVLKDIHGLTLTSYVAVVFSS